MSYILIVDDSELIVSMLDMVCSQAGFATRTCTEFSDVESTIDGTEPHAILSDLNMPDMPHEADPVKSIRELGVEAPIILVSGISQTEIDAKSAELGAQGAVSKDAGMMGMASILPDLLNSF